MTPYLAVMAGAAVGGLSRYLITVAVTQRFPLAAERFPLATFAINVTGCFLIGLIATILNERLQAPREWGLLLVTGVLGGYTTFSSFGYESLQLTRAGHGATAFLYIVSSAALGYLAVWLGSAIARQ